MRLLQVFVANPKKTPEVSEVLRMNAQKLIPYLRSLQENSDDASFLEEKTLLITELQKLQDEGAPSKDEAVVTEKKAAAAASSTRIAEQTNDGNVDEEHV